MLKSFLIPMCFWIAKKANNKKPYFVGLAGGQGTGKTTSVQLIKIILTNILRLKVFKISIDDFYKTRKERLNYQKKYTQCYLQEGCQEHMISNDVKFFKKVKSKNLKN